MTQTIDAIYEDGVLKPLEKLVLGEHEQVSLTVNSPGTSAKSESLANVHVPITTLEPEPFDLLRSIPVVVQPADDSFQATFFDANIGITGDTKEEAVANLRVLLVDVFEELEKEEARLGPQMVKQLAVLRAFMKRRT
ncbi:MAG: antitoxin family protein [Thermoguttaceae bacterium]|jgi:predicted DNA-binding antitoxin AbrB/MazE fold protein